LLPFVAGLDKYQRLNVQLYFNELYLLCYLLLFLFHHVKDRLNRANLISRWIS